MKDAGKLLMLIPVGIFVLLFAAVFLTEAVEHFGPGRVVLALLVAMFLSGAAMFVLGS